MDRAIHLMAKAIIFDRGVQKEMFNKESISSLLSNRIQLLSGEVYITWGIASAIMIMVSANFEGIYLLGFLSVVSLIAFVMSCVFIKNVNDEIDIFNLTFHQKEFLTLLVACLLFSILLTVGFAKHQLIEYIYPIWMFIIGMFNRVLSIFYYNKVFSYYSSFLIVLALGLIGYLFVDVDIDKNAIFITFQNISLVALSLGHFSLGVWLIALRKRKRNAQ